MNKLITKIVGAALGLTMAVGVGVGLAVGSSKEAVPVRAAEGDTIASVSGTGSSYGRQTTTDDYGVGWVTIGQSGYFGINSAKNNTGAKAGVNAADLPVAKAVDSSATSSTSTTSDSCTGYYTFHTTTALTNAGSLVFSYTANSGNQNATGYVVYSSTASSSGGAAWEQVPLAATSTNAQGVSLGTSGTFTFTFAQTQTSAKYYGFVIATSSYKRMTGGTITIKEGATSSPSISVDATSSIKVGSSATLGVTYTNLASGVTISASSDDTSIATISASATTTGAAGTANFTVTGVAEGTANITFSASYGGKNLSDTCEVTVYDEKTLEKISKVSELNTSRADGGRYVIAYAGDNTVVMSTQQNSNNRGKTSATITDGTMAISGANTIALVNILKVGDYYTIYDPANSGYLYAVSGSNYLRTSDPATKTDYYYWSISFSGTNAVITNKGNSYVIRYNSNNSIFSTYNGTQNAVELYEVDDDIPAYVKLTSLTAANDSVQAGSVLHYTASYLPVNATEGITVTGNNDSVATVDSSAMNNGTLTVSITGVTVGSITLSFVGDDASTAIDTSVTITVTSYVATHTLVTSSSSLSNGAKVIIGCTEEGFDFSAEKSTGANNLNGTATGFAADKSTLAAAETSQEFVVWCVDTTNEYYVFSDGGYYLQAPTNANNYLQRTDVLSANCYFTLEDSVDGVTVISNLHNTYSIQFNSSTSKFALYATSQKASSLYISGDAANPIQGFVDVFMHMETYSSNSGYCADENHHYYSDAKTAYTSLSSAQKQTFCTDSAYADAYARLSAWATANGDQIDANYALVQASGMSISNIIDGKNGSTASIIVIVSLVSLTAIGGYFFLKKRKEQ